MKNIFTIIAATILGFSQAFAGETAVAKAPVVVQEELGLTAKAFAVSVIEDSNDYVFGGGVSLEVPVFYDLNLEINGSLLEDELYTVGANIIYYVPVSESISLYAIGGGGYEFETDQWTVGAGAGVKYTLTKELSLFADGVYNWTVENDLEDGVVSVRVGVGFSF